MKRLVMISCLVALGLANGFAQGAPPARATIVRKLGDLLAGHCARRPALELTGADTVVRKDDDGTTWTFAFKAIDAVDIDYVENQAHVLLKCRDAKPCIARTGPAAKTPTALLAFSIDPPDLGDEVARLFKDLRASLVDSAKK